MSIKNIVMVSLIVTHIGMQAIFEEAEELGREVIDAPVSTAGGLVSGALGFVSGATQEAAEILPHAHEQNHHNVRKINKTYVQIRGTQEK